MLFDRLIRAGVWTSNGFEDVRSDSARLVFLCLLHRADDFGCQDGNERELLGDLKRCTDVQTLEQLRAILDDLAAQDLVRRYQAPADDAGDPPKQGLYIPKFRSTRGYAKRRFPPSPWCHPEHERYGQVRRLHLTDQQPEPSLPEHESPNVQVKPMTNGAHDPNPPQNCADASAELRRSAEDPDPTSDSTFQLSMDVEPCKTAQNSADLHKSAKGWGGEGLKDKEREVQSARGSRMTTAWTIPEPWLSWAVGFALDQGHHVTRERFVLIADQFRDYHLQRGQPSRDWLASWRTWIRRENFERLAAGGPTESERRSSFMDRAK